MKINIISIGNKMPNWIKTGFDEYAKRLTYECSLNLIEIAPIKQNLNDNQIIEYEGNQILKKIPKENIIIALDVLGNNLNTEELALKLKSWMQSGKDISLLIGGSLGLSKKCLEKAHFKWSLSPLTFPHMLVRVIVAEQIYRALSILKSHPYHKK